MEAVATTTGHPRVVAADSCGEMYICAVCLLESIAWSALKHVLLYNAAPQHCSPQVQGNSCYIVGMDNTHVPIHDVETHLLHLLLLVVQG